MSGAINRANKKTHPSLLEAAATAVAVVGAVAAAAADQPDAVVFFTFVASNLVLIMAGEFVVNSR